jgi:hypothetical protein
MVQRAGGALGEGTAGGGDRGGEFQVNFKKPRWVQIWLQSWDVTRTKIQFTTAKTAS